MSRLALASMVVACGALSPACGLTLDYAPPDDAGMDAGPRDAAPFDAAGDAPSDDDAMPPDAEVDAPELVDAHVACASSSECPGGNCVHPCDGTGEGYCVAAHACPAVQVCGCDGVIYGDECQANEAGVEVAADPTTCPSVCTLGDPSSCIDGTCATCPGELPVCLLGTEPPCFVGPVCGCDGNNYLGSCEALAAGVRLSTTGFCNPGDCATSADCGLGHFCERSTCGDAFGTCQALPTERDPLVCGCSGRRYRSSVRALVREGLLGECDVCPSLPDTCCADSADCAPTEACVNIDATTGPCGAGTGSCADLGALLVEDACWTDEDCDPGATCIGPEVCDCPALCIRPDVPGLCALP